MSLTPPGAGRWPVRRLGDVLIRHNEVVHPGERTGEATFVGLEHIEPNSGRRIGSSTIDLGSLTGRKPTFRRGQIVYGYLRPYLNKVWIAEFDGYSSVDQFAFDVRSELADTDFVAAFMRSDTFLRRASSLTTPGQLPRIGTEEIAAVPMDLPPLVLQRRLSARLHEQLSTAHSAQLGAQQQVEAAQQLRDAFLREVFEGAQASTWRRCPLATVCRPVEGQVDPRAPQYRDLPHINGESIESGTGQLLETRSAQEDGLISGKYLFEPGMVLYSKLRPYLRKVTIAPTRGLCSADMYPLVFDQSAVLPAFAFFVLLSDPFTAYAIDQSRRARMPKLNRDQLLSWPMPVPPLPEQSTIVDQLTAQFEAARALHLRCRAQLADVAGIASALLREVFEGR